LKTKLYEDLVDWIGKNHKKGYSFEKLMGALVRKGWPKEEVVKAVQQDYLIEFVQYSLDQGYDIQDIKNKILNSSAIKSGKIPKSVVAGAFKPYKKKSSNKKWWIIGAAVLALLLLLALLPLCSTDGTGKDCTDVDGDGYYTECEPYDCVDTDYSINIDAEELCDGIDNNCNGAIDEYCGGYGEEGTPQTGDGDSTETDTTSTSSGGSSSGGSSSSSGSSSSGDDSDDDGYSTSADDGEIITSCCECFDNYGNYDWNLNTDCMNFSQDRRNSCETYITAEGCGLEIEGVTSCCECFDSYGNYDWEISADCIDFTQDRRNSCEAYITAEGCGLEIEEVISCCECLDNDGNYDWEISADCMDFTPTRKNSCENYVSAEGCNLFNGCSSNLDCDTGEVCANDGFCYGCTDSDNGLVYDVYGTTNGVDNTDSYAEYEDFCLDTERVNEYYCTDEFYAEPYVIQNIFHTCDFKCENGACVDCNSNAECGANEICYEGVCQSDGLCQSDADCDGEACANDGNCYPCLDSDNGPDAYTYGYGSGVYYSTTNYMEIKDYCRTSQTVYEVKCIDTYLVYSSATCLANEICYNGACVTGECANDNDCSNIEACDLATLTCVECIDSDNKDATVQGLLSQGVDTSGSLLVNEYDNCQDSTSVVEYYCDGGNAIKVVIDCGVNVCQNGACVPSEFLVAP